MEKPILFSTPMVQAILDGRKTMTRRVVKGLPKDQSGCDLGILKQSNGSITGYGFEKIPYQPGDILWVRETWNCIRFGNGRTVPYHTEYWYKADDKSNNPDDKWRPSIFMPRKACRLFLKVTNVRVERLHDITAEDIRSEGLTSMAVHCLDYEIAVVEWKLLWDVLNKDRGYGWDTNPWVWVIEFERLQS